MQEPKDGDHLGNGWHIYKAEEGKWTGKFYYYNSATGESTWDRPLPQQLIQSNNIDDLSGIQEIIDNPVNKKSKEKELIQKIKNCEKQLYAACGALIQCTDTVVASIVQDLQRSMNSIDKLKSNPTEGTTNQILRGAYIKLTEAKPYITQYQEEQRIKKAPNGIKRANSEISNTHIAVPEPESKKRRESEGPGNSIQTKPTKIEYPMKNLEPSTNKLNPNINLESDVIDLTLDDQDTVFLPEQDTIINTNNENKKETEEEETKSAKEIFLGLVRNKKSLTLGKNFDDFGPYSTQAKHQLIGTLDEQPTPIEFNQELLRYQKMGLYWLLDRERDRETGKSKTSGGGILADDTGLGKTAQMLALCVSHKQIAPPDPNSNLSESQFNRLLAQSRRNKTLLVCFVSIMNQWEEEIVKFISPQHRPRVLIYHGPSRKKPEVFKNYDFIITSYQTVYSETGTPENPRFGSPLTKEKFFRIILDEAHCIKNSVTSTAKSICKLRAPYKWAVTATPVQQTFRDLYSLLKFTGTTSFDSEPDFTSEITKPLFDGNPTQQKRANAKFKKILVANMLRREKTTILQGETKPIVTLPQADLEQIEIDLSLHDREFYDTIYNQEKDIIDRWNKQGTLYQHYLQIMAKILRLRLIADSSLLYMYSLDKAKNIDQPIYKKKTRHWKLEELTTNLQKMVRVLKDEPDLKKKKKLFIELCEIPIANLCTICCNELYGTVITPCGHKFCSQCITAEVHEVGEFCPVCQEALKLEDLRRVVPPKKKNTRSRSEFIADDDFSDLDDFIVEDDYLSEDEGDDTTSFSIFYPKGKPKKKISQQDVPQNIKEIEIIDDGPIISQETSNMDDPIEIDDDDDFLNASTFEIDPVKLEENANENSEMDECTPAGSQPLLMNDENENVNMEIEKKNNNVENVENVDNVDSNLLECSEPQMEEIIDTPEIIVLDDNGDSEKYCICRSTSTEGIMIGCDGCDQWFHIECVGLSTEEAKRKDAYYCEKCQNTTNYSKLTVAALRTELSRREIVIEKKRPLKRELVELLEKNDQENSHETQDQEKDENQINKTISNENENENENEKQTTSNENENQIPNENENENENKPLVVSALEDVAPLMISNSNDIALIEPKEKGKEKEDSNLEFEMEYDEDGKPIFDPSTLKPGVLGTPALPKNQRKAIVVDNSGAPYGTTDTGRFTYDVMDDPNWIARSSKIDHLIKMLKNDLNQDQTIKSLVFSQFTTMLDLIELRLEKEEIGYCRLDGSMSTAERQAAIDTMKYDPKALVFLVSLKAGGVGLNLVFATRAYIIDPWWNPAVEHQAVDRIYRLGQTKPVKIYHFYVKDTIEERISEIQYGKRTITEVALGKVNANTISVTDITKIFDLRALPQLSTKEYHDKFING